MNPAQQRAIEHGAGPMMVLAGAGSGKTRVLVSRIARLLIIGINGIRAAPAAIPLPMSVHFRTSELFPLSIEIPPDFPSSFCAVDDPPFRHIMNVHTAGWSSGSSLGS